MLGHRALGRVSEIGALSGPRASARRHVGGTGTWSLLAISGGHPIDVAAVKTQMVTFATSVVELTEDLSDPVDLLFGAQLGGGTDINRALAYLSCACWRSAIAARRHTIRGTPPRSPRWASRRSRARRICFPISWPPPSIDATSIGGAAQHDIAAVRG